LVSTDSAIISACTGPGEQLQAGKGRNQAPSLEQVPDSFAGMIVSLLHPVMGAAGEPAGVLGTDQGSNVPAQGCSKAAADAPAGEASILLIPVASGYRAAEASARTDADGTLADGTAADRPPVDGAAANRTPGDGAPPDGGTEAGAPAASGRTARFNPTVGTGSVAGQDAETLSHLLDRVRPTGGADSGYNCIETAGTASSEPGLPKAISGLTAVLGRPGAGNAGQIFAPNQEGALTDAVTETLDARTPAGEQVTSTDGMRTAPSAGLPDAGLTATTSRSSAPEGILKTALDLTWSADRSEGATSVWMRSLRPGFTAIYHDRLSEMTDTGIRHTAGDGINMPGMDDNLGLPAARMGLSITEPQASNAGAVSGQSVRGLLGSTVPGYSPDGTSLDNIVEGNAPMHDEQCTTAETGPAGLQNTQSAPGGETVSADGASPDWVDTLLSAALQSAGQVGASGRFRSQDRTAAATLSSEASEIAVEGRAAGLVDEAPRFSYTPPTGQATQQGMISRVIERVIDARAARRNEAQFEIETSTGDTVRVRIALNGRFLTGRIGVGDEQMRALVEGRLWELAQRLESHGLSAQNLGVFVLGGGSGSGRKHQYRGGRTGSPVEDRSETDSQPTLVEIEAKAFDSWA
jgi:hypothetical protein